MNTAQRSTVTLVALLGAGIAIQLAAQDAADAVPSETVSKARSCLNRPAIKRTKVLNDRNIVFITRDNTIYNNQLPKECPSLRRHSLVNYVVDNGRMCAGNKFQVLWEASPNNYVPAFVCELGNFLPITEVELEELTAMTEENRDQRLRRRSTREAVTTQQVELPQTVESPPTATD